MFNDCYHHAIIAPDYSNGVETCRNEGKYVFVVIILDDKIKLSLTLKFFQQLFQ